MDPWFNAKVIATIHYLSADGTPSSEVVSCERPAGPTAVLVTAGPQHLVVEQPTELCVRLPIVSNGARDDFGPGTLKPGDSLWIRDEPSGKIKGRLHVVSVAPVGADVERPETHRRWRERPMEASVASDGIVRCPTCGIRFLLHDRWRWTGLHHRPCGQRLRLTGIDHQVEPVWSVVGNIVGEHRSGPGGSEVERGTKHFSPGTKVYCFPPLWGDGYENIRVVGRHRGSKRWVTMVIRSAWVTNWRAKLVHEPAVVDRLSGFWDGQEDSKKRATELAAAMAGRATPFVG